MKRHLLFLAAMLSSWCVFAQPAPILRNPWTTNALPQVSAGTNILIITNAGHKLVVNTFGLASQASFTSLSNSFFTLSNNFVTLSNNFVSLSNAAITGIVGRTNILVSAATNHVITLDVIGGGGGGAFIPNLNGLGTNLSLFGVGATALTIDGSASASTTLDVAGGPGSLALNVLGGNGTMADTAGGGSTIISGNGADSFSGIGGSLLFQSGNGGLGAIAVDMVSPGGIGGDGGSFAFNSGQGGDGGEAAGDQVAGDGGVGAAFAITSGNGGAGGGGSAANPGGVGGNAGGITIMGGNAGLGGADGGGGAGANGTAGTITINGGQGGGSNATIFLQTFGGASLNIGGVNYKFPTVQGAAGTFLTNNGSGVLTWAPLPSSTDATKIAIIGGGGTNNTFTNANFTNVTATGIPANFGQGAGLTNSIVRFWAGGSNRWSFEANGSFIAGADGVYTIGALSSGRPVTIYATSDLILNTSGNNGARLIGLNNGLIINRSDNNGMAFISSALFNIAAPAIKFGDNSGANGTSSLIHSLANGVFGFSNNAATVSATLRFANWTNSVATTNQAPYAWSNFNAAATWTNYNQRSLLVFDVTNNLDTLGSLCSITVSQTNLAGTFARTNRINLQSGASVSVISAITHEVDLEPNCRFGFQTNNSGTSTATTGNVLIGPN